ncbi:MAG: nucleotide sugar dehydrogenase [Deltaproteobacteria bacterium]|nr:nucleotide sugar dehydrogenase [Deltaproteobacteria bacterium]
MKTVCVLGLGYVGLPTAAMLAAAGYRVVGVDTDARVVARLAAGEPHLDEPGLATVVRAALRSGNLRPAVQPAAADVFVIAVPTPLIREGALPRADLEAVRTAAAAIVPCLQAGNLVLLESTSPPGTTRGVLAAAIERGGLVAGRDVDVAYCPERVIPGNILKELIANARIVGGLTPRSAERAAELYRSFVEGEIICTDATTAELVKLMENTYRDVNIALANELARMAEELGVDAGRVVELANHHPRVHLHRPGPGVGGHCIGVDPWFLVERFPARTKLIRAAREINDQVPSLVVERVRRLVAGVVRPKIALLGLAYKGDVGDVRESPAIRVRDLLRELGGVVVAEHDPHAGDRRDEAALTSCLQDAHLVLLLAPHTAYRRLRPAQVASLVARPLVLDTHGHLDRAAWRAAGFQVEVLGAGGAD